MTFLKSYNIENLKSITSVIKDFDFFAAPKWKILSDSQGSGNTANIGSINNKEITSGKVRTYLTQEGD